MDWDAAAFILSAAAVNTLLEADRDTPTACAARTAADTLSKLDLVEETIFEANSSTAETKLA